MCSTRKKTLMVLTAVALLTLVPFTIVSACAGFALLAFLPGRILLRPLGLEKHWTTTGRVSLSVAVSLAVTPFFLNPLWHLTHDRYVVLAAVWCATIVLVLLRKEGDGPISRSNECQPLFEYRSTRFVMGVVAFVVSSAVILPYWPTELLGFPMPAQIHDFIKHHAILDSLERHRLPLGNLFYAEGAHEPVYYYHFFYLIPATVRLWTSHALSLELAYGLGSAVVALATTAMVYTITKRFAGREGPAVLAVLLVTLIGALDIIPLTGHMIRIARPVIVQDAWAMHEFRIHNFLNQFVWAPQNVMGVLIVLVAVYLMSLRAHWRGWLLLGPVLGASVIGASVWVAMGALSGLVIWVATRRRTLKGALVVAVFMAALSLPTLVGYADSNARHEKSLTTDYPRNTHAVLGRMVEPGVVANFLDLPILLVIEFGARVLFLPLVPREIWRRMWRDDGMRWLFFSAILSLIAFNVVHSNLSYNAFGQRIVLLPMVFTSILAGCVVTREPVRARSWNPVSWPRFDNRRSRHLRIVMAAVLVAGLPVGLWEAPLGTVRRYAEELWTHRHRGAVEQERVDAEHAAFKFMRHELPAHAVVQPDPSPDRATLAQIVRRQLGVIAPQDDVLVFDPPDRRRYLDCVREVSETLRHDGSASRTHRILRQRKITHVFIGAVERRMWEHLERFDDSRYFTEVFRQGPSRVIALEPLFGEESTVLDSR